MPNEPKVREVTSCFTCPFVDWMETLEVYSCFHRDRSEVIHVEYEQRDSVPDKCPLKEGPLLVVLVKAGKRHAPPVT